VVLLRAGAPAMELLMMRRSPTASQFGGAFVFPGGLLEADDAQPRSLRRVIGMTAAEANARLELSADGLAYWVAVVRECYEEAGILLALDEREQPVAKEQLARWAPQRAALNARQLCFADFLEQERLLIPAHSIVYAAHWITPPIQQRRFDTRFFIASAPPGQEVAHDNSELVESVWLAPGEVLVRAQRNAMSLTLPTQTLVSAMGKLPSPAAALDQARAQAHVPLVRPCIAQGREGPKVYSSSDPPYAEIHWVDPEGTGASSYDLLPGVPKKLDRYVTRLLAPNASYMTGPGTNCYLVGERELAVIDPGPDDPAHLAAIVAAGAGRIRWILLTHTHTDHALGAAALRAATGARISGRPAPADTEHNVTVAFDRVLADGDAVTLDGCALRAIHTPGHASNHLCYLLEQTRMLFSGDQVVQGFTVVIVPPDGNMGEYLRSLERLASLDIAILAPGHGYLIGNPAAEMARLIAHRLAREGKVRRALLEAGGSATLQQLLPRVYDDVAVTLHAMAARSLQAHLEKLQADGELTPNGERWVQRGQVAG
jgi:glyoxylase-like metal-dependent hydrolase (beta-lactamase superfamily II)/8-oxo-dGTP pyrophosphatase MutT (NUDIX family)